MKKTAVLLAVLVLTALFSAPAHADLIDPGLIDPGILEPVVPDWEEDEAEEETEPANEAAPETPAEQAPSAETEPSAAPTPASNGNRVDSEAKSLSGPVTALAAGLLLIAIGAFIRAIVRNHKEAKTDRGMKVS